MPRPQTHRCRPELCGYATDTNSTVGAGLQGTLAGHPARDTLRDHLCLAMAANFPPSVGAGLQGTLAGYPARRNIARLPLSRDGREYSPICRGGARPARRNILATRNFADCDG